MSGMILNFINWNPDPTAFSIFGGWEVKWYGVLFGSSFLAGYFVVKAFFKKEGIKQEVLDSLVIYMVLGTFIGARLGHVFFYEPARYLENPIEILQVWHGGLASHGAAIGIITSLIIFSRFVSKKSPLWILDRIVVVVALSGLFIRSGNLINSEIVGSPTGSKSYGFVFQNPNAGDQSPFMQIESRNSGENKLTIYQDPNEEAYPKVQLAWSADPAKEPVQFVQKEFLDPPVGDGFITYIDREADRAPNYYYLLYKSTNRTGTGVLDVSRFLPRHPAQIYEAIAYTLIFILLMFLYYRKDGKIPQGQFFALFLILAFTARFLIEFYKKEQVPFEADMALNMGQLLSIPLVLAGVFFLIRSMKRDHEGKPIESETKSTSASKDSESQG